MSKAYHILGKNWSHQKVDPTPPPPDFDPSDISDMEIWYGDTMNGVDRSTLANGTSITVWNDQSGNGNHANTTPWTYPVWNTTEQGLAAGSTDYAGLQSASNVGISGSAARTVVTLVRDTVDHTSARSGNYVGWGSSSSGRRWLTEVYTANRFSINGYSMDMYWTYNDGSYYSAGDEFLMITYNTGTNGTSIDCRLNGAQGIDLNTNTTTINTTDAVLSVQIGPNTAPRYIKEVIIYSKVLSTEEFENLETWFNNKYSIW